MSEAISTRFLVDYRFAVVLFHKLISPVPVPYLSDFRFKSISGLEISRTLEGKQDYELLSSSENYRDLTLTRGIATDLSPLTLVQLAESALWKRKLLETEILIASVDENWTPLYAWWIRRAFLQSWSWNDLDASSNDVLVESMVYKYATAIPVPVGQFLPL